MSKSWPLGQLYYTDTPGWAAVPDSAMIALLTAFSMSHANSWLSSWASDSVWIQMTCVLWKDCVTYSCMWAKLLCSAQRATVCQAQARPHVIRQQWCNNNDRAPRPSLWLCLWHWHETNRAQACSAASEMFDWEWFDASPHAMVHNNLIFTCTRLLNTIGDKKGIYLFCYLYTHISTFANKR